MESTPKVLLVQGSLHQRSSTAAMLFHLRDRLRDLGAATEVLDLRQRALPHFSPGAPEPENLGWIREQVENSAVFVLGTPDYHGTPSGPMKNFLDYFWTEFTGKLFGYISASHEKGLTAMDTLRIAVRQCYGWSLPYGVAGVEKSEVEPEGAVLSDKLRDRLEMMAYDLLHYGHLIAGQRQRDLSGHHHGFMARHR